MTAKHIRLLPSRKTWLILVLAASGALLIAAVWLGALLAISGSHLSAARSALTSGTISLDSPTQLVQALETASGHTESATQASSQPIWRVAEMVPMLGNNFATARAAAESSNSLIEAFSQLAVTVDETGILKAPSGITNIDFEALAAVQREMEHTRLTSDNALRQMTESPDTGLVPVLAEARTLLIDQLEPIVAALSSATNMLAAIPSVFGAEQPQKVLVLFQNSAEYRSIGGVPSAMMLLRAESGTLELVGQASSTDFPAFDPPIDSAVDSEQSLAGELPRQYIQDVGLLPDVPRAFSLAASMWEAKTGQRVDSVISLDAQTMAQLIGVVGGVEAEPFGMVTEANAGEVLFSAVYSTFAEPSEQDAFFASFARTFFEQITSPEVDARSLVKVLSGAATHHGILMWARDQSAESALVQAGVGSMLPGATAGSDGFGIYLNDGTAAKMDYYLGVGVGKLVQSCRADGRREVWIDVTLTNTAPADSASTLPEYVTGGGVGGVTPGSIRTNILSYGNPESFALGVWQGGRQRGFGSALAGTHPVMTVAVELAPGESQTVQFRFLAARPGQRAVQLITTPLLATQEALPMVGVCDAE